MEFRVVHWGLADPPTEEDLVEKLEEQELRVYRWTSPASSTLAGHTHGYHKVLYVIEGSIKFDFPTRHEVVNLGLGDRLELPAGVRHSATVGVNGVRCLEAHIY